MNRRIIIPAAIVVLILAAAAWAVRAAAVEPVARIHEIQRPLFGVPAFVRAGESFRIELKTGADQTPASVVLSPVGNIGTPIRLNFKPDPQLPGAILADVPADAPESLRDLAVEFSGGLSDSQPHAVKIVKEFKKDFNFVHITDIHFFQREYKDKNSNDIRMRLIRDIAKYNPEFVVFTGDICQNDFGTFYISFLNLLGAPLFMVPGNHDLEIIRTPGGGVIDGKNFWAATFGPLYFSADYGDIHLVGINTHDWPDKYREETPENVEKLGVGKTAVIGDEQWNWLKNDLRAASQSGRTTFAFTHIPVEFLQGGMRIGNEKIPGPSASQFIQIMNKGRVTHIFVGHVHFNSERPLGAGGAVEIVTEAAGTDTKKGPDPHWGFRVAHVSGGRITGYEIHEIGFDDLDKK
jgi:hypothetical protein